MKSETFYHAFRTDYQGIARQLLTPCTVAVPSAVNDARDKKFEQFNALWDTGATNSVITKKVVDALGIKPSGVTETYGVHGLRPVNTYVVDIGLPNKICIADVQVTEGDLISHFDMLIGMDVIMLGDFAIANAEGKTRFSFCIPPHKNPIDLLEKSDRVNPKIKVPAPIRAGEL